MKPARWPRADAAEARLLHIDRAEGRISHGHVRDLPPWLRPSDLLVVNDAATLPASLHGAVNGAEIELRLLGRQQDGAWEAVLFGAGDWHQDTERRPAPPRLAEGERLQLGRLTARIERVSAQSPRLLQVRFECDEESLWSALYREGAPVQYSYLAGPLDLWHVQTAYAARPWAAEAPSAGFALTGEMLIALRRRGVSLASLTHAAGLSSTGDPALDAALPLGERFDIPSRTVEAITSTRSRGGRIVAVGTTVVRAIEGAALQPGGLTPGTGLTTLRIGPGFRPAVVQGLLTGIHDPAASHYALLQAFAPGALLDEATACAEEWGFLGHEFGDATLIL
jgi:S-adenosylmethionine:tRNA ribosyltransferase-isomerase